MNRLVCCLLLIVFLVAAPARADNPAWFVKLYEQVGAVVKAQHPSATTKIHPHTFEYQVSENGKVRDLLRVEMRKGMYKGDETLPSLQKIGRDYALMSAPYADGCDCHLLVHIYDRRPEGADEHSSFIESAHELLLGFSGMVLQ